MHTLQPSQHTHCRKKDLQIQIQKTETLLILAKHSSIFLKKRNSRDKSKANKQLVLPPEPPYSPRPEYIKTNNTPLQPLLPFLPQPSRNNVLFYSSINPHLQATSRQTPSDISRQRLHTQYIESKHRAHARVSECSR
jgi:hypothetical protein